MQNSVFWSRITSVNGSQTWPIVLCMQKSVISTWITSLYWSQPSCAVFGCKTATYGLEWQFYMGSSHHLCFSSCKTATLWPDLQICMVPRPLLWFWAHITACLAQEYKDYMGSSLHLCICACKTATLAHELLVSIGPSPHLRFLHANQRLLDQNCMSLWVPEITCDFLHGKQLA